VDLKEFEVMVAAAHRGQIDKAGQPYWGHLSRVQGYAESILASLPEGLLSDEEVEEILMAAIGHDSIEDTSLDRPALEAAGVPEKTISMIEAVSNNEWEGTYREKIEKIAADGDLGTIIVKLADNTDNRNAERLAALPEDKSAKLGKKYAMARAILEDAFDRVLALLVAAETREAPSIRV
jgi:(p)ppGpp synthase/HD superfamily hydrolase